MTLIRPSKRERCFHEAMVMNQTESGRCFGREIDLRMRTSGVNEFASNDPFIDEDNQTRVSAPQPSIVGN
jgi:hypothetical protein